MSMRVLVIGSDSFIARRYIQSLCKQGVSVTGVSRVVSGEQYDVFCPDFRTIEDALFDVDVVINFAAIVHRSDIKDAMLYDDVNYKLTVFNAQKALRARVSLFIQMSTIAVYGNARDISFETLCKPNNLYGISKLKADVELLNMQTNDFKVAIVRPPMVYGGGNAPGNMLRLIKLVNTKIPLPFANASNKRDFVHVNNLVQYLTLITQLQLCGIFIVTDYEPVSTEQLVKLIAKHLEINARLFKLPRVVVFLLKKMRFGIYEKLYGELRVKPNFPIDDRIQNRSSVEAGIKEMVDSFRNNVN